MLSIQTLGKELLKQYYETYDNNLKTYGTLFTTNAIIYVNDKEFTNFDDFEKFVGNNKIIHHISQSTVQKISDTIVMCTHGKIIIYSNNNFNVNNFYETLIFSQINGLYYVANSVQFIN